MLISKVKTRKAAEELCNDGMKFAEFVERNKRFLMNILSKVNDKENYDADDLFQESQIALYSALQTYNPEQRIAEGKKSASFSTYSYALIKNEIVHWINEQNKIIAGEKSIDSIVQTVEEQHLITDKPTTLRDKILLSHKTDGFEEEVIRKMDEETIISKLSTTEKIIFEERIIKNKTHDEVAAVLKIPSATYMTIYYKSFLPKLKTLCQSVLGIAVQ